MPTFARPRPARRTQPQLSQAAAAHLEDLAEHPADSPNPGLCGLCRELDKHGLLPRPT